MEKEDSNLAFPTPEIMVRAMELVRERGGRSPLIEAGNVLATACVVAAALHPEWAATVASHASSAVLALAEELVAGVLTTGHS